MCPMSQNIPYSDGVLSLKVLTITIFSVPVAAVKFPVSSDMEEGERRHTPPPPPPAQPPLPPPPAALQPSGRVSPPQVTCVACTFANPGWAAVCAICATPLLPEGREQTARQQQQEEQGCTEEPGRAVLFEGGGGGGADVSGDDVFCGGSDGGARRRPVAASGEMGSESDEWAVLGGALLGAAMGGFGALIGDGGRGGGGSDSDSTESGGGVGEAALRGAGVGALTGLLAGLAGDMVQERTETTVHWNRGGATGGHDAEVGNDAQGGGGFGAALQRLLDATLQAETSQSVGGASAADIARLPTAAVHKSDDCCAGASAGAYDGGSGCSSSSSSSSSDGGGGGGSSSGTQLHEPCAICLEELVEGELAKTLPCFHVFHAKCADQWLAISGVCPVCKHVL